MYDDIPHYNYNPMNERKVNILKGLGFENTQHKLIVTHPLTDRYGILHDFTAIAEQCLSEYAIKRLFDVAIKLGRNQVKAEYNSMLQQETIANY